MFDLIVPVFSRLLPVALLILVGWVLCLYTYRLTLHPLAKFPGPKLAAASRWYEFYYDVVLKGQYTFHLQGLHKKYGRVTAALGPIIRISPVELHIDDPDFFDTFYAKSGRLHKYARDSVRFANAGSVFATADAEFHRMRRTALNPFFSKKSVAAFEPFVRSKVDRMLDNLASYRGTGKPVTLSLGYMALAGDVILQYCFGYNFDQVESKGFKENFHDMIVNTLQSGALAVHFPIVMTIIMSLPESFVVWSTPLFALLFKLQHRVVEDVKRLRQQEKADASKADSQHPNVMQFLMQSDLPDTEKSDQRLQDEGQNFVGAGVSTTGWALSVASFHLINNRSLYKKLRAELDSVIPDPKAPDALDWNKLEQCTYLTACLKEAIRLAYAISGRFPRLSDSVIQYGDWQIPPLTPTSMTMMDLSHNEDIFPDSWTYKPERWLGGVTTKAGEPIEKYWFGFLRGSRNCLGVHLAWLELYMALAGVFRNFDLELFETDESDVVTKHDFLVPCPKLDTRGVRVLVK